jgi:hypothetical protein
MVSDSFAVCDRVLLEASKVTDVSPAATSTGTVKVTSWLLPTGTENGDVGDVVAPKGRPVISTDTGEANPFSAVVRRVITGLVSPTPTLTVSCASDTVKSGEGGEAGQNQQANIGNAVQVNNGAAAAATEKPPNKLLEKQRNEWMERGAASTSVPVDPEMEAVGAVHRAASGRW